jgi:hypothetical protein
MIKEKQACAAGSLCQVVSSVFGLDVTWATFKNNLEYHVSFSAIFYAMKEAVCFSSPELVLQATKLMDEENLV